ncbi:MAG TPA: hypothetical protein VHJ18_21050 [Streptosporangiaceae bacterium]|nr:hypothetical protein [Streptosporangiaceae bacterium]
MAHHAPQAVDSILIEVAGGLDVSQLAQGDGQVVGRVEGVGMVLAQDPAATGKSGLVQIA